MTYMATIKRILPKKPRTVELGSAVKKASKPRRRQTLSKSDPDYYSKIGAISAEKRQISSETFSEMARKSHENRPKSSYRGGRPPKKKTA
jgi:hypothetical protein